MEICSNKHEEIVYTGGKCPICELIDQKDGEIEDLNDQISDLETEISDLRVEIEELKEQRDG